MRVICGGPTPLAIEPLVEVIPVLGLCCGEWDNTWPSDHYHVLVNGTHVHSARTASTAWKAI